MLKVSCPRSPLPEDGSQKGRRSYVEASFLPRFSTIFFGDTSLGPFSRRIFMLPSKSFLSPKSFFQRRWTRLNKISVNLVSLCFSPVSSDFWIYCTLLPFPSPLLGLLKAKGPRDWVSSVIPAEIVHHFPIYPPSFLWLSVYSHVRSVANPVPDITFLGPRSRAFSFCRPPRELSPDPIPVPIISTACMLLS